MAVYAGQAKRKRATYLVAAGALIVGLVLGIVVGRATAPTIQDKIADGRAGGRELVTALQVLPLEYAQAQSGSEGTALIGDTVQRSVARLNSALDGAPWLSVAQRRIATQAVQSVVSAGTQKVPAAQFKNTVDQASSQIAQVFGITVASAG
jgi:hypothetical protein